MQEDIKQAFDAMTGEKPSEEMVADVQQVVNTLVKTLKIFRTYPRENSMVKTAIDNLTSTFADHFERHPALELFVDRHELQWKGMTVYAEPDQRRSFALKLDRDGVRRMLFKKGLTREEAIAFLETLTAEVADDSLNDDLVTLLWEKQLEHVKIFVLNEIEPDAGFDEDLVDADTPESGEGKGSGKFSDEGDGEEVADIQGAIQFLSHCCRETMDKMEPFSEERQQLLHLQVQEESSRNASGDLVDILFDLMLTENDEQVLANAVRVLLELALIDIRNEDLDGASDIIQRLRSMAADDSGTLSNDRRALIVERMKDMSEERAAGTLIGLLRQQSGMPGEQLASFLKMLPAEIAPRLCELFDTETFLPILEQVLPELAADNPEMLLPPFEQLDDEGALTLLRILDSIARPQIIEPLSSLLTSKGLAVREASVPLLAKFKGPASRKTLLAYAADDSPSLRRAALKVLTEMGGGGEVQELRAQVAQPGFEDRSLDDKKGLFITLARLEGPASVPFLVAIASGRRWFESQRHQETRACAVFALGEVNEDDARTALEQCARDKSETVRAAARLALSRSAPTSPVGS